MTRFGRNRRPLMFALLGLSALSVCAEATILANAAAIPHWPSLVLAAMVASFVLMMVGLGIGLSPLLQDQNRLERR